MAATLLRVVLCLALAAAASCQKPLTLAALPKNITVKITGFENAGMMMAPNPPCMTQDFGSCPTVLQAASDTLSVSYAIPAAVKLPNFASVSLYACYSPHSYFDRAWRAPNKANLAKSKDCAFVIKKGLKGPTGNATWEVPHEVPHSTMYVRAYALCAKDDGTSVRCAYGNSPGFFEVHKINDIPLNMKIACIICCFISPIMVGLIMWYEKKTKKHH